MKILFKLSVFIILATSITANAGNPDRAGGAGATQLLINPYAKSTGLGGSNTASVRGIEASYLNIAGLAYAQKTEIIFSRVEYLLGTDVNINNLGFAQTLGEDGSGGVLGLGLTSWEFGNIPRTTYEQPDQTLGTYSPQVLNLGISYAKKFSNSITGGILLRFISEGLSNVGATGLGVDAGVQYQTALNQKDKIKKEDFRFGIAVRNIGPDMSFTGDGLSFNSIVVSTNATRKAMFSTQRFNLPALVNIGVSYDMRLDNGDTYFHRLTASGNFNYNAFSSNILGFGAEYAFKETFMLRGAYNLQEDIDKIFSKNSAYEYRTPVYGIWGGFTMQMPITRSGSVFAIDYSYAPTRFFNGIHTIGVRLNLAG